MATPTTPENVSCAVELQELEIVIDALGRSSRPATLLRYLVDRRLGGESDQLTEYNIATEVFGRSKTMFDPGQDAIVRVEIHRLRKKLKEFYDGPGIKRTIRIAIAQGSYSPVFSHVPVPCESVEMTGSPQEPVERSAELPIVNEILAPKRQTPSGLWFYTAGAAIIVSIMIFALYRGYRRSAIGRIVATSAPSAALSTPGGATHAAAILPLRILAGYTGKPEIDSTGVIWGPDKYVRGGGPWRRPDGAIARTNNPLIFGQWRNGDFQYDIPLKSGDYELHLFFVAPGHSDNYPSTFSLRINGALVLNGFDINEDAMGDNIADERIFRDVSPASDGYLHLAFASESGAPQLNALELLQGIPNKQIPIRIVTQQSSFTDSHGEFWQADNYYMNGSLSDHASQTVGSSDPNLFDMERFGHFSYAIPVDTRDRYTVILHFAEFYFGPQRPGGGGVGSRLFKVICNGETLLDNFDIYKEAGSLHVLTKTFHHVKPSAQGKINLTFEPIINNATVSGIEVIDEGN